jgi:iron complex transport system substrate-binding protein
MYRSVNIVIIILTFCVIFSCGKVPSNSGKPFLRIRDDLNREVEFISKPTRIISLAPSITETLFALDKGKTLIAVTDYCDYPSNARLKTSIGGMVTPSFEKIADLKPDLILITVEGNNREDFNKLQNLGYKIFVTKPKDIEGIYKSINDVGKIIGAESSAYALIRSMRGRQLTVTSQAAKSPKMKILTIISLQPLISAGNGTFINELIKMAGGENIVSGTVLPYPILNREEVLKQNPDIIVVMDDVVKNQEEVLRFFPEWKNINAFRSRKVFLVDGDILSRPGPRIIEGLEKISSIIRLCF